MKLEELRVEAEKQGYMLVKARDVTERKYVFGTFEKDDVTERLSNDECFEGLLGHIEENGLMDEIIMRAVDDMRDWVDWSAGDAMWDALDVGVFKTTGKHLSEWEG